ncbi:11360_t:CDS:2, partial [Funneliformis geosporum]
FYTAIHIAEDDTKKEFIEPELPSQHQIGIGFVQAPAKEEDIAEICEH